MPLLMLDKLDYATLMLVFVQVHVAAIMAMDHVQESMQHYTKSP